MKQFLFSFCVVLIIFTFFLYSIEYMYTRLERFMFPRKHLLQAALKKISKDLTSTFSFRELKDLILLDIVNTLQVYGGAIVFKYRDSTEIIHEGEIDTKEVERLVAEDVPDEHPELMSFEINRHEEYTSFLVMTRKKSNTRLGLEEVQWLNLIISYLAVSLENVYLIRKLTDKLNRLASQLPGEQEARDFNWFRKLSFELQERERVRIATDLHDTTMQDLFFLKRKLAAVGAKDELSAETKETIRGLVEYIEIINVNLRQSCFDLNPYLLQEVGLVRTIEKIVERESYSCPFQIKFDASHVQAIERKDLEFKRHLFRIVQELLNNAKKHSEASLVHVRLTTLGGKFVLHYRDDGVGFDPESLDAPDMGASGVGMEQLRSRILHMQGQLELEAGQGSGVDIRISFPMKEGLTA
ncbi:sensor histidine kinase [Paenibacillus sp. GYB003]|uniref:sensor histidine kinase n=1 Tax=Paenibacillus sp. GYB003 TaxID=2994392 RepID=UPI002F96DB1E